MDALVVERSPGNLVTTADLLIAYYSTAVVTWLLNCLRAVPKNSEHTQFLRTLTSTHYWYYTLKMAS